MTITIYSFLLLIFTTSLECVTINDDPSLWPGHLEPFGSKQKIVPIEVLDEFPDPETFFKDFVGRSRPAIFRNLAKRSPAYQLWNDEYLKNLPGANETLVFIEPDLKENRSNVEGARDIPLLEFLDIYHTSPIYMVQGLPKILRKDVLIPSPLRCESTRPLLQDAVTWFSGGGTRSVLHNDGSDNMNCLFRGSKDLLMISYHENKKFVPLDINPGSYSSLDVDKVNYTKYPELRKVDQYVHAHMEAGDCLFIPFLWFHQVNSKASKEGQNVAVNVWFEHSKGHVPTGCEIPENEATMDKYTFKELEKQGGLFGGEDDEERNKGKVSEYESYLSMTKHKRANFKTFYSIYIKVITQGAPTELFKDFQLSTSMKTMFKEVFDKLNMVEDPYLDVKDFDALEEMDEDERQEIEDYLQDMEEKIQSKLYNDLNGVEDDGEDETSEEFVEKTKTEL